MKGPIAQVAAVTALSLRCIPQRPMSALTTVITVSAVTLTFVCLMSMLEGLRSAFQPSSSAAIAIVVRNGSSSEFSSDITRDLLPIIASAVRSQNHEGTESIMSPEIAVVVPLSFADSGTTANAVLRGVGADAQRLRADFRMVEGRMFRAGTNEIVVGAGVEREFAGLGVEAEASLGRGTWRVVGRFVTDGGLAESEIWADLKVLQSVYERGGHYQSVRFRLPANGTIDAYRRSLSQHRATAFSVELERDFQGRQWRVLRNLIFGAQWLLSLTMGACAVVATMNSMQFAIVHRVSEIATLRALGFAALPIAISVMAEALLLGAIGGLAGGCIAFALFDGSTTSTLNWQSITQISFVFDVTPATIGAGTVYALLLTLLGGMPSSIAAVRGPIAQRLRD